MRVESLTIKSFRDCIPRTLEFEGVNLLIGKNYTGKTTLMEMIERAGKGLIAGLHENDDVGVNLGLKRADGPPPTLIADEPGAMWLHLNNLHEENLRTNLGLYMRERETHQVFIDTQNISIVNYFSQLRIPYDDFTIIYCSRSVSDLGIESFDWRNLTDAEGKDLADRITGQKSFVFGAPRSLSGALHDAGFW